MTVEIDLPIPDPPRRSYPTHSHIHTGPLVITLTPLFPTIFIVSHSLLYCWSRDVDRWFRWSTIRVQYHSNMTVSLTPQESISLLQHILDLDYFPSFPFLFWTLNRQTVYYEQQINRETGGVFRGPRHVTSTSSHSGSRHVKSLSLTGTGTRHVTSLPLDRDSTRHVVFSYQGIIPSVVQWSVDDFYLHRFDPLFLFRWRSFFSLFDSPYSSHTHFDTSPSGTFGCNGTHGESAWPDETEVGFLRSQWIIGLPFVDRKSLTRKTLSPLITRDRDGTKTGWQCGRLCWVTNLVDNPLSIKPCLSQSLL